MSINLFLRCKYYYFILCKNDILLHQNVINHSDPNSLLRLTKQKIDKEVMFRYLEILLKSFFRSITCKYFFNKPFRSQMLKTG